jgi:hypothetical protein
MNQDARLLANGPNGFFVLVFDLYTTLLAGGITGQRQSQHDCPHHLLTARNDFKEQIRFSKSFLPNFNFVKRCYFIAHNFLDSGFIVCVSKLEML